jgi:hypothetical protein
MPEKNIMGETGSKGKKRRPQRNRYSLEVDRQLASLELTDENRAHVGQINRALLLWSGFMLDISPRFASALYAALTDEWIKHVRGVLYADNPIEDERDPTFAALNAVVLDALDDAKGETGNQRSLSEIVRIHRVLRAGSEMFRRLAQSAAKGLAGEIEPLFDLDGGQKLLELRDKLAALDRSPENEGERFRLESEIYQLELEGDHDDWSDVIAD